MKLGRPHGQGVFEQQDEPIGVNVHVHVNSSMLPETGHVARANRDRAGQEAGARGDACVSKTATYDMREFPQRFFGNALPHWLMPHTAPHFILHYKLPMPPVLAPPATHPNYV